MMKVQVLTSMAQVLVVVFAEQLPVETVHHKHVNSDQKNKDVNAPLLGKPEAELDPRSGQIDLVELVNKQNSTPVGHDKPNRQEPSQSGKVLSPV